MIRLASLLFALALLTAPALAQDAPDPGLRYAVTGVAASDVLNIRRAAAGDAEIAATLAAGAVDVIVTGRAQQLGAATWWEIALPGAGGEIGWANARFLSPLNPATGEAEAGYPLQCLGTEPFWSLKISADSAAFSTPSDPERSYGAGGWLPAQGLRGRFAVKLSSADGAGYAVVQRERNFCSDGMSDVSYPFGVTVILPGDHVLGGCCSRAAQ